MRIVFQILFVLFSAFAVCAVVKKYRSRSLGKSGAFFWICFWIAAAGAVVWPNGTQILADLLGIGRGTDVVLYISVAFIFYILFRLNVKLDALNRDITKVVRKNALDDKKINIV